MNIRRFKTLHAAGATYVDIARKCGGDWHNVRRYLADDAHRPPHRYLEGGHSTASDHRRRRCTHRRDAAQRYHHRSLGDRRTPRWRKVYDRELPTIQIYCRTAYPIIQDEIHAAESGLGNLHRRFETIAGAQAQVDWGDEGDLFGTGIKAYSLHMVFSFSRDPFCCYTHSMDAAAFWGCHIRAFAHFGGVPARSVTTER